jgi:predicted lipoprotein with Yx(FWY)xxD motif
MHRTLKATLFLAALALPACSSAANTPDAAPVAATGTAAPTTAAAAPVVKVADGPLGKMLVGPEGLTLYGFTNDADGSSSCYDRCAAAWPPVLVENGWDVGPGLDAGVFATTTRKDGTQQLVAGKWPLYYYSGDAAPGDVAGQGSGNVWFAVDPAGALIKTPAPAPGTPKAAPTAATAAHVADTKLGSVLVDANGRTLYGFTKDADGNPTCAGACADAWPAAIVEDGKLPAGLDPAVFSVVARPDGRSQLKAGKWPLYRFAGDAAPGDVNGQNSGGVWFVVDGKGGLVKQAGAPAAAPAPATTAAATTANRGGYSGY